jgi:hypothetical protein
MVTPVKSLFVCLSSLGPLKKVASMSFHPYGYATYIARNFCRLGQPPHLIFCSALILLYAT